jgi:IS5 family transposase
MLGAAVALYNLSDEQIEYQVRDRLSFTRFVGLGFETVFRTALRFGSSARSWRRRA